MINVGIFVALFLADLKPICKDADALMSTDKGFAIVRLTGNTVTTYDPSGKPRKEISFPSGVEVLGVTTEEHLVLWQIPQWVAGLSEFDGKEHKNLSMGHVPVEYWFRRGAMLDLYRSSLGVTNGEIALDIKPVHDDDRFDYWPGSSSFFVVRVVGEGEGTVTHYQLHGPPISRRLKSKLGSPVDPRIPARALVALGPERVATFFDIGGFPKELLASVPVLVSHPEWHRPADTSVDQVLGIVNCKTGIARPIAVLRKWLQPVADIFEEDRDALADAGDGKHVAMLAGSDVYLVEFR